MVSFRQATKEDAQILKDIARRVVQTNYAPFLGKDATDAFLISGMSDKEIDDGLKDCTVIIRGGQTIGFAITNEAVLHIIMIDVTFQNSGYGSMLLEYIEGKLFSRFKCIYLQTFKENVLTVRFYLKHGWTVTAQEEVPEMGKTMLKFQKSISRNGFSV